MATILEFKRSEQIVSRSEGSNSETPSARIREGKTAEIHLFPGIRYQREEEEKSLKSLFSRERLELGE